MFISVSAKLLIKELKELYFIRGIIKAIASPLTSCYSAVSVVSGNSELTSGEAQLRISAWSLSSSSLS